METSAPPSLLPILRSQHQAHILTALLADPSVEVSLSDLGAQLGIPVPTVHREIERAESVGLVTSRRVGRSRLVTADTTSPYYEGLSDVLVKAFGPPRVIAEALEAIDGIEAAYVFGSWAERYLGGTGVRPVGDVDVLVLGEPDRDSLYATISEAEQRLGRPVQITIRPAGWLREGSGSFHATVTHRALVDVPIKTR